MNIPPKEIPAGIDYQLVTVAVAGDRSFSRLSKFEENGWRRVPTKRHPSIRSDDPNWVESGGQALVERPKLLTEQARKFEQAKADAQVLTVARCMGMALQVNGRPLNPKAIKIAAKRKKSFKEFFVFHTWRFRVWARNRLASWRK